jgi:prepilin-type N-terminal cleavage/methylation domain-containing protein
MARNKGFTLIELLVVIAIIVILATLAMTSYRTANVRARDARRAADMEQVRSALELYRSDTSINAYPNPTDNGGSIVDCTGNPTAASFTDMISELDVYWPSGEVPLDPQDDTVNVNYKYCSDGSSYTLEYVDESGPLTQTLHNP